MKEHDSLYETWNNECAISHSPWATGTSHLRAYATHINLNEDNWLSIHWSISIGKLLNLFQIYIQCWLRVCAVTLPVRCFSAADNAASLLLRYISRTSFTWRRNPSRPHMWKSSVTNTCSGRSQCSSLAFEIVTRLNVDMITRYVDIFWFDCSR